MLGAIMAASMLMALALVGVAWALRTVWNRLTGRPAQPWRPRFSVRWPPDLRDRFNENRAASGAAPDVIDVESKEIARH
jgi:hypothetical protein